MRDNSMKYIISLFFISASLSTLSADSTFAHPLQVEPVTVYKKVRVDARGVENRESGNYDRQRNVSFEAEWSFLDMFSVKGGGGAAKYESTGNKPSTLTDRWNLGLKFGKSFGGESFRFGVGAGMRLFNKQTGASPYYQNAPDLYLVKPSFSLGMGFGALDIVAEMSLVSETNPSFHEKVKQDFRRHYVKGLSVSYGLDNNQVRLFLETLYYEPYDKRVDKNIDSWYMCPGISYKLYESGFITASAQVPMRNELYTWDRGLKISYFHFFE